MVWVTTWDARKTVGAVAVAAAIAGFGGTAIAAATDIGGHGMPGGMRGGGHGGGWGGQDFVPPPRGVDADPESLHGENVVAVGHGGFQTLLSQTGRVTAISATSVTVRSDDGFVQTYVIREAASATQPPFHTGDRVTIRATRQGETAMVTTMGPPL